MTLEYIIYLQRGLDTMVANDCDFGTITFVRLISLGAPSDDAQLHDSTTYRWSIM